MALVSLLGLQASAQTILDEGFETGSTERITKKVAAGEGWTTVNSYSGSNAGYNWHNYYSDPESQTGPTITGACTAACDAPVTSDPKADGVGPREEILLTPELDLNDTYQLQFTWKVSPMNSQENSRYDLQVRVVEDGNLQSAETVFSIQDENMLRESGVTVFPITTWDQHISKVDLSDWKGKKVKLAFVYKLYTISANIVWLDDVKVSKFTPPTGPKPAVSLDRYDFKSLYIGEKLYSDVIRLTNVGKNGLQITGVDFPAGVGTNVDFSKVNLRTYEYVDFQLTYTAAMTSVASGNAVIHTNGGDITIAFSATKELVPDGSMLETFNDYFPPAGWRNNGWSQSNAAIEGDASVYCGGGFSASYLRSPMLDLTNGGKVTFSYYNQYDGESVPEYDIELQVSYDGGDNWTTKWKSDYQSGLNQLLTETVDLGTGTDESYIRWFYPAIESDDEGAYDHSNFTLDRVLLPNVVGMDAAPGKATLLTPANNAENVYPKNVVLTWGPALFAKGYKVYVGTNDGVNDLVEAVNVGDALTYTIPQVAYETTYKWKIVAYNDKGETASTTYRFTSQKDASVMEFPYSENFDACNKDNPVPGGWLSETTNQYPFAKWSPNNIYPYGGKGVSLAAGWMSAGFYSQLTSPEFSLPAEGKNMQISFVWGDEHPADLIVDQTGLLKKENVEGGNGKSEVVFEIFDGTEWKQAAYLSENYIKDLDGKKYWRNEVVDLTQYAGKKVQFRWTSRALSGGSDGAALDNIVIDGVVEDNVAYNKTEWNAGKVNYKKGTKSADITLLNTGKKTQKVKSVSFQTNQFQSSIAVGQEIAAGEGITFNLTFNGGEEAKAVTDEMTVEFESGLKSTFPVSGESLAKDVLYYAFEPNDLDYNWKTDFTMIDADKLTNHELGYYQTVVENDGTKYAFTQVTNNNTLMLAAISGNHTIAAAAPAAGGAANDWLISKQLYIGEGATFDFYGRNLGTTNTVFIGDNDLHRVTVLVSEAGNTDTNDFKVVMAETEMPYLDENKWNHYTADLSAYAGKKVYVALRHTTISANAMAFFDDFTFTHVLDAADPDGIQHISSDMSADAQVTVYTLGGVQVANGRGAALLKQLDKGVYVVKVSDGTQTKTQRIVRK